MRLSREALRWRSRIRAFTGNEMMLEVWVDQMPESVWRKQSGHICALIKESPVPVIGVCRGAGEKGAFPGTENERIARLMHLVQCGAKYIDCGLQTKTAAIGALKKTCQSHRARLILSHHDYLRTPPLDKLMKILHKAGRLGADIVKIAAQVRSVPDNAMLFELTARTVAKKIPCIIIGIGAAGQISRFACPVLGSWLTYASRSDTSRTASGQLSIRSFLSAPLWRFK